MFGMRDHDGRHGQWAAGRHGRHPFGRGHGKRHDREHGDSDWFRVGRMLAHGDLKLLALALIEEQPRHGYELIKLVEEKTSGFYSPSPGVVYPTLTFLEEAGYAAPATSEGTKKTYAITEAGREHLKENRGIADMILERLAAIGERYARRRRRWEGETGDVPKLVEAALDNLRATAVKELEKNAEAETTIVEILARAAKDIRNA